MDQSSSSTSLDMVSSFSSTLHDIPSSSSSTQSTNIDSNNVSGFSVKFTTDSITTYLKYKKTQFTIVDRENSAASCWKVFGLPAKILGPNKYEIIKKFASCKSCYRTYSYTSTTTTLSNHKCPVLTATTQSTLQLLPVPNSNISSPLIHNKANEKQKSSFNTLVSD